MKNFKMSTTTRDRFAASLSGLTSGQKSEILKAVADLLAETEIQIREDVFRNLRKDWSNALSTMLNHKKRT